ncbi:acetylornithine deacetylase related protein [Thermoplasma acidophilum]|uniref:Acetylornithine deacetylase related protein n=1 Tax=Thermoplasma acidophilum (strain ATCC 25905 / DSM 1728 / JCM 9062 / NBRC 15155 / AMRC-C165) TaxID=273075 RepID=Q9HJN3_THEAC|nr:M20 family metallo-hydrolase [Thermoplasma acidophilum]MCY0852263.1 M20 family metallo-hydrolase [Thermoplasma acidophilum]CAC12063.1 acetylornithine deacetylase related protein [Thermoplasma acidophilum]
MDLISMPDRDFIVEVARRIIRIPAISPASGGEGEKDRADEIEKILRELGYNDYQRYDMKDEYGKIRSNIVIRAGKGEKVLWLVAHIDTVPVGDPALWTKPPFDVTVEGDRMYGRGTEDDGQAVFTALLILRDIKKNGLKQKMQFGVAFVADEEMGSKYGIQYLLEKDIFRKSDLIIVPDAGSEDGMTIEIAEKSILWIRFSVKGKQWHASMPVNAINAFREGSKFMIDLDRRLHEKFTVKDDLYNVPYSTFEPTKHEKNVDNVNTIPGTDTFYFDCRVLPQYSLDDVLKTVDEAISDFQAHSQARISYDLVQKEQAPKKTPEDSEVVVRLMESIKKKRGKTPKAIGIGGGTCAAFFRRLDIPAVVWFTTIEENAHRPDEFCLISHILMDRDVLEDVLVS